MHRPVHKILTAVIGLTLANSAFAQQSQPANAACRPDPNNAGALICPSAGIGSIPFDLLPPGARSLGLGGAFTAVADDATAAEANPAGLTQLTRPEISIHGRRTSFDLREFNGDGGYADTYNGAATSPIPLFTRINDNTTAVSFASAVYPFENGAVSLYYQNTGKIKGSSHDTAFATTFVDQFTFDNQVDITAEALGLSGAYRLNDFVSVGASVRYSRFSVKASSRSELDNFFDFELSGIDPNTITDRITVFRQVNDDDKDLTYNLGMLFNPGGKVSVGIVYKNAGSYTLRQTQAINLDLSVPSVQVDIHRANIQTLRQKIDLPDSLNVGVAYRPNDKWLMALDAHYVRYSQLPPLPSTSALFANAAPGATAVTAPDGSSGFQVKLSNSTSYHFGLERVFTFEQGMMMGMNSVALRAGVFNEKDLGGYNRPSGPPQVPLSSFAQSDRQALDTRDTHYTVGVGTTFGQHVQVDLAAEFSKDTDNVVLSAIYRF